LYRREGWREEKRKRAGDDGKGKEIREKERKKKKFGAILNALYGKDSRPFPLPIVPRALSVFRLLLFLLGYPAGASAKERGLDTSLISIDVFIAVHFSLAFVC